MKFTFSFHDIEESEKVPGRKVKVELRRDRCAPTVKPGVYPGVIDRVCREHVAIRVLEKHCGVPGGFLVTAETKDLNGVWIEHLYE